MSMAESSMPAPEVSIIGAGIAGLALARCLLQRGIRATVFERDSAQAFSKRYNYAITLQSGAYRPLLRDCLKLDESSFLNKVSVGGFTVAQNTTGINTNNDAKKDNGGVRANRNKFEQLLADGIDMRWEHHLSEVKRGDASTATNGLRLLFRNGESVHSNLVVGADGPHSVVRHSVSPTTGFEVLPFAVYNGRRRVSRTVFDTKFATALGEAAVLERRLGDNTLLKISIDDIPSDASKDVSISYNFSRRGSGDTADPLYRPNRAKEEATQIPEELFSTISSMNQHLHEPFKTVFDADAMRQDRLLNWLMRSMLVPRADLDAAVSSGIMLVGDCVHGTPILGGDGANQAILDGIALADVIAGGSTSSTSLGAFYDKRYTAWEESIASSQERLAQMHLMHSSDANAEARL